MAGVGAGELGRRTLGPAAPSRSLYIGRIITPERTAVAARGSSEGLKLILRALIVGVGISIVVSILLVIGLMQLIDLLIGSLEQLGMEKLASRLEQNSRSVISITVSVISIIVSVTMGLMIESFRRERRYRLAERLRQEMVRDDDFLRRILNNGLLNEFLREYFARCIQPPAGALLRPGLRLITIGGYVYPVVCVECRRDDVNSVIDAHDISSNDYMEFRREFVFEDTRAPRKVRKLCKKFLNSFKRLDETRGRGHEDRPKYSMEVLNSGVGLLRIRIRYGQFYSEIASCEVLKYELVKMLRELIYCSGPWCNFSIFYNMLEVRKYIHDRLRGSSPLVDGRYRDAAIGISTLTAYKDEKRGGYVLLLGVRSPSSP